MESSHHLLLKISNPGNVNSGYTLSRNFYTNAAGCVKKYSFQHCNDKVNPQISRVAWINGDIAVRWNT